MQLAGQRIVVVGANGGVGMAAVALAHRLGAEVIAVVRDGVHEARLQGLGADHVIVDPGPPSFHKHALLKDLGAGWFLPNLAGCAVMGCALLHRGALAARHRTLLVGITTGFCGCLTTFATWNHARPHQISIPLFAFGLPTLCV